ncbi:MAG: delta-60 repeat domain-containing protein [Proteobacteria bacterium]|nr:delta-60 repeat domain-containing protein [Pseudomonadota bacterium]
MKKTISIIIPFIFLFLSINLSYSLTFNDGFNPNVDGMIRALAVQENGKILIGGYFTYVNGVKKNYIARLNQDGSLDETFDCKVNQYVNFISLQNDGKILIGGNFTNVNGIERIRVARLNPDGTLDSTFKADANGFVASIIPYSDNKILIGGDFTEINGLPKIRLAMLDYNGNIDESFNAEVGGGVRSIAVQVDNKIIIGGYFISVNGITRNNIARLNPDGSLDQTFNILVNNGVESVAIQVDGKIVMGGLFTSVGGAMRNYIARLNSDGSLDSTFNIGVNNTVFRVLVQGDGKILLGGGFTTLGGLARNNLGRINFDGSLDSSFNPQFDNWIYDVAIQRDGKIIAVGNFSNVNGTLRNGIARIYNDGKVDKDLISNTDDVVYAIALQRDQKILIGGGFTQVNSVIKQGIARINNDGSLDSTFNSIINIGQIYCIAIQNDGKIIIAGNFSQVNGVIRNNIARLNQDGSLDNLFNPNVNKPIYALAIQSDGKILIGGSFTQVGLTSINYLARLNIDGSLEEGFKHDINEDVYTIAIQKDGNVLIGGKFTSIGIFSRNYIARINKSGGVDLSFNPGANGYVYSIAIVNDDTFIVGGLFTQIGGISRDRIAKLNSLGGVVESFNASANSLVNSIVIQSDNKILIGGYFTTINGITRNYIARLHSNGVLDTTLNQDVNNYVFSIAVQFDNKILVGGTFTQAGGLTRQRFARLSPEYSYDNLILDPNGDKITWTSYGSSILDYVFFEYSVNGLFWVLLGYGTKDIYGDWVLTGLSLPYEEIGYIRANGRVIGGSRNSSSGIISSIQQFYNTYLLDVGISGNGKGSVVDNTGGISCGSDCSEIFPKNTVVTLYAIPSHDAEFVNWEGSCTGTNPIIDVEMSSYKNCRAVFQKVIYLKNGDYVTTSASIELNLYPVGTPTEMIIFAGKTWSRKEAYVNTKIITVPGGDGKKEVFVRLLIDGNWKEYRDSIYLDVKSPVGGIQINGGSSITLSTNVTLNLHVVDFQDYDKLFMKFSNDKINWTDWEPFKNIRAYLLTDGEGLKTVYVQYKDSGGKVSPIYSDSIVYSNVLGYIFDPARIEINFGELFTNKTGVILSLNPPDVTYTKMSLSQDAVKWTTWALITSPKSLSLTGQDGIKRVYVKFKKDDGTESNIYYDEIILDRKKPVGVLLINNGAYITNNNLVNLTFNIADELSGIKKVLLSNDGVNYNIEYNYPVGLPINFTLSGEGVKKVFMKVIDNAGNISVPIMDSIVLDMTAPTGKVIINNGASTTTNPTVTLTISATGAVWMMVSVDGVLDTEKWENYSTKKIVTLPSGVGTKEVRIKFKDLAGNESLVYSDTIELR